MKKDYKDFKDLLHDIRQIKSHVINLKGKKLSEYCDYFYSLPFKEWKLDTLWEYIWSDRTYEEICKVFKIDAERDEMNETKR